MCSSTTTKTTELSPEEERILIKDIALAAQSTSKEGDSFYLLTQRWWQHWVDYVNEEQQHPLRPSPIDNSDLIYESDETSFDIHDTLHEGRDYVILPQQVWNQLHTWYGGGPPLPRRAILSHTDMAVEVHPLRLQLLLLMPKFHPTTIRISKKETIGELHRRACEIFDLIPEHVCIWDYDGRLKHALMSDVDKTLEEANIQMDQDVRLTVPIYVPFGY